MSSFDQNVVQNALYAKIVGNAALMALLSTTSAYAGVYRLDVPEGAPYPYIYFFRVTAPPVDTFDTKQQRILYQIEVYTQASGSKEAPELAGDIITAIDGVLNRQTLSFTGFICCEFDIDLGEEYDNETKIARSIVQYVIRASVEN